MNIISAAKFYLFCLLHPQVLSGKFVLRFAVGAPLTEERHVDAAWKLLQDEATKVLGKMV